MCWITIVHTAPLNQQTRVVVSNHHVIHCASPKKQIRKAMINVNMSSNLFYNLPKESMFPWDLLSFERTKTAI